MRIDILTIFPRIFDDFLCHGMVRRARKMNRLEVHVMDLRGTTEDRHRTVDDRPYGGGPGMLLKPEPVFRALDLLGFEAGDKPEEGTQLVLLCPQGQRLDQECLEGFATRERLVMLCGRYEGYDERIIVPVAPPLDRGLRPLGRRGASDGADRRGLPAVAGGTRG